MFEACQQQCNVNSQYTLIKVVECAGTERF